MKNYLSSHKIASILGISAFIILAVILMTSFSFPDLFALNYVPNIFFTDNIYTWVRNNKSVCPWLDATYPPLYYFTIGLYLKIIQFLKLLPATIFSQNQCPVSELLSDKLFLFWVKLPLLIFHILTASVFSKLFTKNRNRWFWFWLLNPIALFVTLIEGQFEIIPTFFLLASILAAKKDHKLLSAVLLGIGGAYKNFPFLLLIPFTWIINKKFKAKITYVGASLIPYLLSSLMVTGSDYGKSLTFSENFKMLNFGFNIGEAKVSVYVVLYILLFLHLIIQKNRDRLTLLLKYGFLFYLIYFLTAFWFVQRLLFLVPLMILITVRNQKLFKLLPFVWISYFVYVLVMFPGLFDHSLLRSIMVLPSFDYSVIDLELIKSIVATIVWSLLTWFGIQVLISKDSEKTVEISNKNIFVQIFVLFFYIVTILILAYFSFRQISF